MKLNKVCRALLFPHVAIMLLLVPLSTALLVCSMVLLGSDSPLSYAAYALSAYTLTVWCLRAPRLWHTLKSFKEQNKYALRWQNDARLRVNVSLYGSLAWNALYGLFQLWLGFYHRTFWFYSLGAYYICLGVMRFFLLLHTRKYRPGEKISAELRKYRACGWIFLVMNLALTLIIFFMVYWNRTFSHHEITTIAMAAYTFTAFTTAIVSIVRYRKYNSPVYSASKAISLAAACVSMLTLTSTMLTTFSDGTMPASAGRWLTGAVGLAVSAFVVTMAIYMINQSSKKLRSLRSEVQINGKQ